MLFVRRSQNLIKNSKKLSIFKAQTKKLNSLIVSNQKVFIPSSIQTVRRFSSKIEEIYRNADYNYHCLSKMQEKSCEIFKDKPLFGTRNGPKFDWLTYGDFAKEVNKFRWVLAHHGIGKNDKVAIISNNRTEWAVVAYASASLGAQYVPM